MVLRSANRERIHIRKRLRSVYEAFSICLESKARQWVEHDEEDHRECQFLYSVTRKVLSLGMLRNSGTTRLLEATPVVFTEELSEELSAIASKISSSSKRKKNIREGGSRKRLKAQE